MIDNNAPLCIKCRANVQMYGSPYCHSCYTEGEPISVIGCNPNDPPRIGCGGESSVPGSPFNTIGCAAVFPTHASCCNIVAPNMSPPSHVQQTSEWPVKPHFQPGYHLVEIKKGIPGEFSKIEEEFAEAKDAMNQNNPLMALQELTDLIGAIELFACKHNFTLADLLAMKDATKRAFQSGRRK